jgi:hypothetical protein
MKKLKPLFVASFVIFSDIFVVFLFMMLEGCSTNTPFLSYRNDKATIVIEKPPTRIILSGEYKDINVTQILMIMEELKKHPYKKYHFNDSVIIESGHLTNTVDISCTKE